ncbi:hypothetical protein QT970_22510 [Microcoleus sp. herbarium8]|uniref:hypothetical protein n=1 Tax=Microcoleus sp. herbarium8 TaxID=3055436 RepID=UPI002FD5BBB3
MPFQKNNKLGAKRLGNEPLEKSVIAFRGRDGQKKALQNISGWQDKLRDFVDHLISNEDSV